MNLLFRILIAIITPLIAVFCGNWCGFWGLSFGGAIYSFTKALQSKIADDYAIVFILGISILGSACICYCIKMESWFTVFCMATWIVSAILFHVLWTPAIKYTLKTYDYLYVLYFK